jgi:hypothetical protein
MVWFDRHRRLRDQLSAYIDGELDERAAERLEAHLAGCAPCREQVEQLRATSAALRALPEIDPPRSFALSPERAAERGPAPSPSLPTLAIGMRLATAGAAVALAAVILVDLGDSGGEGPGGVPQAQVSYDRDEALRGENYETHQNGPAPEEPSNELDGATGGVGGADVGDVAPTSGEDAATDGDMAGGPAAGGGGGGGTGTDAGGGAGGAGTGGGDGGGTGGDTGEEVSDTLPSRSEDTDSSALEAPDAQTNRDKVIEDVPASPEPESGAGDDADAAPDDDGGGIEVLTVVEIALGVALVAFGVGSILSVRRQRERQT